jgi:pilus assembly protein CpaE
MQAAQGLRPDSLYSVLISLRRAFDVIVIDAGSLLNENSVTYLDAADRILLLTTPDLSSLRDASRFIQISQSLSYPPEKLLVVMNREGMPGGVGAKDVEDTLRQTLFARIPECTSEVQRSLNRGVPLILKYPRSPASRAIRQMTKALTEMRAVDPVRIPVGKTIDKAQMEALLVSSQFG